MSDDYPKLIKSEKIMSDSMLLLIDHKHLAELQKLASTGKPTKLTRQLLMECKDEYKKIAETNKGPLTVDQQAMLVEAMVILVTTKKPINLCKSHDEDWFFLNKQGKVEWNWKNSSAPFNYLAKRKKLLTQYCNTIGPDIGSMVEKVKKDKRVKAIKQRIKDKG